MVQELVHVALRRRGDRAAAVGLAENVRRLCVMHEFTGEDLTGAMELYVAHEALDMRDAVYAATARGKGLEHVISTDRAFDGIPGLRRADPADEATLAALAG